MSNVGISMQLTQNLGNFESVKIEVTVSNVETKSEETVAQAIDRVYALVERKLGEKMQLALEELKG